MNTDYQAFLAGKRRLPPSSGIDVAPDDLLCRDGLFAFQAAIVAWAVQRGRAAVWADTGLGKTRIQVAWLAQVLADTGRRGLILAPLAVAQQTVAEAARIGVDVAYVHDQAEADQYGTQIVITNYDRLHKIDPARYEAVVLDESSILKSYSGPTKRALVQAFAGTRYRLSCSATPAPNDLEELCNHADFLSVMSPQEMRSTFFIADSRGEFMKYRLKGHAKDAFYNWLASWAIACRHPRDLGFEQAGYDLPTLHIHDHLVQTGWSADGELFTPRLEGITARAQVRKDTLAERCATALSLIEAEPGEQWLVWVGRNDESALMAELIADALPDCVTAEVNGSDDADVKAAELTAFAERRTQILVTKASIAGMGLNFQSCARMAFVGLGDSYEQYYQAIRRCHRYGQDRPVQAHIVLADAEEVIIRNVRAKEATARATSRGLISAIADNNRADLFGGTSKGDSYEPTAPMSIPHWLRSAA